MAQRIRPGVCQICRHADRQRIELMRCSGVSLDAVATKFAVHRDAVWRHMRDHCSDELKLHYLAGPIAVEKLRERAAEENLSVLDYLSIARSMLVGQLTVCAEANDSLRVSMLVGRLTEVLTAIGKITGEVEKIGSSINVTNNVAIFSSPQFLSLQQGLITLAKKTSCGESGHYFFIEGSGLAHCAGRNRGRTHQCGLKLPSSPSSHQRSRPSRRFAPNRHRRQAMTGLLGCSWAAAAPARH